ncbi:NTP transferase domain-containing protein [Cytophagaceae bacterium ABcell3]|nr:NTP transferase domain-containing protein [Cytophagaceae bacterium ABcell3]
MLSYFKKHLLSPDSDLDKSLSVVVLCAGKSSRFKQHYPKHLATIQGIPSIVRVIKQLKRNNVHDISMTVSEDNQKYFKNIKVNKILGSDKREIDRFRNAFDFINNKEKVLFLYGDVVYHDSDIQTILNSAKETGNKFFGRYGKNTLTHKPYGELFGILINDKEKFFNTVNKVVDLYDKKLIKREIGWEVYRVSEGLDPLVHKIKDNFIELSQLTDDYDTFEQYKIICKLHHSATFQEKSHEPIAG